jgi:hypothetical protein
MSALPAPQESVARSIDFKWWSRRYDSSRVFASAPIRPCRKAATVGSTLMKWWRGFDVGLHSQSLAYPTLRYRALSSLRGEEPHLVSQFG